MDNEILQIRRELLIWAGLYRGRYINEAAMPEFHRIIDRLEQLAKERPVAHRDNPFFVDVPGSENAV